MNKEKRLRLFEWNEIKEFEFLSFYIKDAVRVAETGPELLARANVLHFRSRLASSFKKKKIGILVENIPPREKARYWIEELNLMHGLWN
ncbi:unnamed protein product [Rhizophagus irregularis]|nr:unnamed protein product [Rhizophagus irregularis]